MQYSVDAVEAMCEVQIKILLSWHPGHEIIKLNLKFNIINPIQWFNYIKQWRGCDRNAIRKIGMVLEVVKLKNKKQR